MQLWYLRPARFADKPVGISAALLLGWIGLSFFLLATGVGNPAFAAQQPPRWATDQQVPGYPDDTFTPYLIADQNRTVHAFASQWVGDRDSQLAIVYRQWSLAGGWTEPMDILLSPYKQARMQAAFLDRAGMLHLVFAGGDDQGAGIYYSRAPAASAGRATAWSAPRLVSERASFSGYASLTGDDEGNLAIVYDGNVEGNGVYAVHSSDAGDTWSEPTPVFLTYDPELTPYKIEMYTSPSGNIHAAWNVVTPTGTDISAYYARLDMDRMQWSKPVVLEERTVDDKEHFGPSFPSIRGSGDSVVVMYNSGNPSAGGPVDPGRPVQRVRLSNDGGRTWGDPITPFPRHQGRSGEHSLAVDSNGNVHALFIQRIDQLVDGRYAPISGMWHSELRGGHWSEPDRFTTTIPAHDVRAVVSQGNVLLVTWREDPGTGQHGIWYSYTTLDAPELPAMPLPTPPATPTATPVPTATPPGPTPTPLHRPASISQEAMPAKVADSPAIPLALGLAPVALLIVGIILAQQLHYHRRH